MMLIEVDTKSLRKAIDGTRVNRQNLIYDPNTVVNELLNLMTDIVQTNVITLTKIAKVARLTTKVANLTTTIATLRTEGANLLIEITNLRAMNIALSNSVNALTAAGEALTQETKLLKLK